MKLQLLVEPQACARTGIAVDKDHIFTPKICQAQNIFRVGRCGHQALFTLCQGNDKSRPVRKKVSNEWEVVFPVSIQEMAPGKVGQSLAKCDQSVQASNRQDQDVQKFFKLPG